MDRAPAERSRLYFLLAWFHAVIVERVRYVPVGWTKAYEFSDADQACALDIIDAWVIFGWIFLSYENNLLVRLHSAL